MTKNNQLENNIKILDDINHIKTVDPSGMYDKIHDFPEQLLEAAQIGRQWNLDPSDYAGIKNIVVAGMGGSAIGGDLVRSYLSGKINIPFHISRHYRLPHFADKYSLVVASSYSGNTEETLTAFDDALSREAKVVCLTTGGKLGELARSKNLPVATLPKGYPPRAALAFSFLPLLFLIYKLNLTEISEDDIAALVSGLKRYRESYLVSVKADRNPAKSLALHLFGKIPIIYTGPELTDAVGTRWKGQICENAKALAFNNQFPEFNHNELVGWNKIDNYRDRLVVVHLRDSDDNPRVAKRMAIVKSIIEKEQVEVIEISSQGDFPLGHMFSLIQLGDFASFYLAVLNNIDPTPVKIIDHLKKELAGN